MDDRLRVMGDTFRARLDERTLDMMKRIAGDLVALGSRSPGARPTD
jgi:hypothetical protein